MRNFTVRLPEDLIDRMRRYRWVNWSEIIRRSIEDYLSKIEEMEKREPTSKLMERLIKMGVDPRELEPLDPETEYKLYKEMVNMEWRRLTY